MAARPRLGLFRRDQPRQAIGHDRHSQAEGQKLVKALAAKVDVLIENYKVGTLARYGLDYESIRRINPKIIYCSITGFGQTGPYRDRPATTTSFRP